MGQCIRGLQKGSVGTILGRYVCSFGKEPWPSICTYPPRSWIRTLLFAPVCFYFSCSYRQWACWGCGVMQGALPCLKGVRSACVAMQDTNGSILSFSSNTYFSLPSIFHMSLAKQCTSTTFRSIYWCATCCCSSHPARISKHGCEPRVGSRFFFSFQMGCRY